MNVHSKVIDLQYVPMLKNTNIIPIGLDLYKKFITLKTSERYKRENFRNNLYAVNQKRL